MIAPEPEGSTTRDELMQRIALMETMIAEGRNSTARFGWIFVLWGVVNLVGVGWSYLQPHSYWVWPVTIGSGFLIQFIGIALRRRVGQCDSKNMKGRSIAAVWGMMGLAIILFIAPAVVQNRVGQMSTAGIFMFLGLAHATSAQILRWRTQGVVAAIWWIGGVATYFVSSANVLKIYIAEMIFGMIFFGLYAMWLERRRAAIQGRQHA